MQIKLKKLIANSVPKQNGCLEWKGFLNKGRYGQTKILGKTELVHRVVWKLVYGEIPEGLCVLHSCDNRPCINIEHLFLGTKTDNNRDRDKKGRQAKGNKIWTNKLSEQDIQIIIKMAQHGFFYKTIALEFGIHPEYAALIARQNGVVKGHIKRYEPHINIKIYLENLKRYKWERNFCS
jgi:hypothetical protein